MTPPRPFAGLRFGLPAGSGDHLVDFWRTALMVADPFEGERQLITGYDALALAQLSSFPRPDVFRQACPAP